MAFQPTLKSSIPEIGRIDYSIKRSHTVYPFGKFKIDDAHIHSCYEVYVNLSGDVSFLHGNSIFDIEPYDIVFSKPGELHHCIYQPHLPHDHYCLWFNDEEGGLKKMLDMHSPASHLRLGEQNKSRLCALLEELESENSSDIEKTACLYSIISLICCGVGKKSVTRKSKSTEILEYIDENLAEIRRISEIAEAFYLSPSSLNRILKEETSLSPQRILEAKRLTAAEGLLREGMGVTEVCYAVGFSDCSRFITKFKNKFGVTPHKYKSFVRKSEH